MAPSPHPFAILLLIALAANLDNLGVGMAYGLIHRKISPLANFVIALMAVGLTYTSMVIGASLSTVIHTSMTNALGATIIAVLGVRLIWEVPLQRIWHQASRGVSLKRLLPLRATPLPCRELAAALNLPISRIRFKETLTLGISLSLNAMAGGVGASLSGYNPLLLSLATGIFSYGMIEVGQCLADSYLSTRFGTLAQPIAGIVLIGIGVYEFFV